MGTLCFGLFVMFCTPQEQAPAPASSYCDVAKPIYWNAADTRKTKEQVDTHNRVWKRLCGAGKGK